jgi:Retrotransposon gag protein
MMPPQKRAQSYRQHTDRPPRGSISLPGGWYSFQGRTITYSDTFKKWYYPTPWSANEVTILSEEDFVSDNRPLGSRPPPRSHRPELAQEASIGEQQGSPSPELTKEKTTESYPYLPTWYPSNPSNLVLPTENIFAPLPPTYTPLVAPSVPFTLGIPSTSSQNPFLPSIMSVTTNIREVKIRSPNDFLGEPKLTKKFLQDCELYLEVNDQIYDTPKKKIVFALSFMTRGTAAGWKESFINKACSWTPVDFGTWDAFKAAVTAAFEPIDNQGATRTQMKNLKQETSGVQDYISQFRILKGRSGLTDDASLIEYFMDGLHPKLLEKVYGMETVPATLEYWMKAVAKWEGQHRHAQAIIKGLRSSSTHITPASNLTPSTPARDPNAMDIDHLSTAEHAEHMRKGKCFVCHQTGHRASVHKNGATPPHNTQGQFVSQKKWGKDTTKKIWAILEDLDTEEKETALKEMEEAGF